MDSIGCIRSMCLQAAKALGDYQALTVNELADGFCTAMDSGDEANKNAYVSALILRFWYVLNKMYVKHHIALHLEREDFYVWLVGAIMLACSPANRVWQDPEKHTNAQAVINQTLATRFEAAAYYEANLQCNKSYYSSDSLDAEIDDNGTTFGDLLSEDSESMEARVEVHSLIQSFVTDGKLIEAIILDNIAFNDVFKHETKRVKTTDSAGKAYKYSEHFVEFWPYKLVQVLNELSDNYLGYFTTKYTVDAAVARVAIKALKTAPNTKKYKFVRKTLTAAEKVFAT